MEAQGAGSYAIAGIAKGYAIDEAARIFRQYGVENFYIDAGGDVYAGGVNCSGEKWRIGLRHPSGDDELLDIIHVSNQAVTTSGNYAQFYEIEGRLYSHIIDPRTGFPQEYVTSATVIAPTAETADALSTALCVLTPREGIELILSQDNRHEGDYAALIITTDQDSAYERFETENYKKNQSK